VYVYFSDIAEKINESALLLPVLAANILSASAEARNKSAMLRIDLSIRRKFV